MRKYFLFGFFISFIAIDFFVAHPAQAEEWSLMSSGVANDFNNIACPTETTCYIVGGAPFIGGEGIILKTVDAGRSWVRQTIPTTAPLRGIACSSVTLCYAAGDSGAVLKTVDGGDHWLLSSVGTPANTPWFWDIDILNENTAVAVGNVGAIFRTTDGSTWTRVTAPVNENLHGVHFGTDMVGWILGSGGTFLKTTNGGVDWLPVTVSGNTVLFWAADSVQQQNLWFVGSSVRRSSDGGLSSSLQDTRESNVYRGVSFIDENNGWIVGGGGRIFKTTDGGNIWANELSGTGVILRDISCFNSGICYAVGDDGVILRRGAQAYEGESVSNVGGLVPEKTPPQRIQNLFSHNLTSLQRKKVNSVKKVNNATKRKQGVQINTSVFTDNRFTLNVFNNSAVQIDVQKRSNKSGGKTVMKGNVSGKVEEAATIVIKNGKVAGNLRTNEGIYEIRYAGNGAHIVKFIDPKLLPGDKHVTPPKRNVPAQTVVPPARLANVIAVINVMIAYTPQALDTLDGDADAMEALIELMVEEANDAFERSHAGIRLNLVRVVPVLWRDVEQSDAAETLEFITNTLNIRVRGIFRSLRNDLNADIATLLVEEGGNSCGSGWQLNSDVASYFADYTSNVVDVDCISNYAYPHEVGHNMGLAHDANNADTVPLYPYGYGYQDPQGLFRTIMAYPCENGENGCSRIPYFSNPDITLFGRIFGIRDEADEARALRNSRWFVRDLRGGASEGADRSSDDSATASGDERREKGTGKLQSPRAKKVVPKKSIIKKATPRKGKAPATRKVAPKQ